MSLVEQSATRAASDADVLGAVLAALVKVLRERGSPLVGEAGIDPSLEVQTISIVCETLANSRDDEVSVPLVGFEYGAPETLARHGRLVAMRGVDPSQPLMAAEILFGVALPIIVEHLTGESDIPDDIRVSLALHAAIWRRFPPGAIAYVEVMREQIEHANVESQLRMSRELHDRFAHGVAAAILRVDLAQSETDPDSVNGHLDRARSSLTTVVEEMRELAFDLRQLVGDGELATAIERYADEAGVTPEQIHVVRSGVTRTLPVFVKEQCFAIVIEAIRNAMQHGGANRVEVEVAWSETKLVIAVRSPGLDRGAPMARSRGLGLPGLTERAGSIASEVHFVQDATRTELALVVPFA